MSETSNFFNLDEPLIPGISDERIVRTAAVFATLLRVESHTKKVPVQQIITELWDDTGIPAYDEQGNPAGYVANRFTGLLGEAVLVPGDVPLTERRVPHFCIGSLIVAPADRGQGLASTLVNTALMTARGRWYSGLHALCAADEPAAVGVASAVATSGASRRLFADNGFWPTDSVEIAAAHGYDDNDPLPRTKLLMNRTVAL
ncbi:MAG TPA: GNAT family N-acetyltransferase [Candidatus Saccharimonadales bacterium]|jgi:GNAT superfamily N-acetyltransferase